MISRLSFCFLLAFVTFNLGLIGSNAAPVINEFLADNGGGLADEDGDFSDWIEIYNPGPGVADLDGYFLTDDLSVPMRWEVPAGVSLPVGGYRLVFASGKNRGSGVGELHTNFSLGAGGESVALIAPDGVTVVSSFENYPQQRQDVSFGNGGDVETLVGSANSARALVPASGILGATWRGGSEPFDDSSWKAGTNGAGYDSSTGTGSVLPDSKASADFDFLYEQNVGSHTQDLDNNGTVDFFAGNVNDLPILSGGIATVANGDRYRTDYSNSLIRDNFNANEPFTIEARVRVLTSGGAEGSRGTLGLFYRDSDGSGAVSYVGRGETGYLTGSYGKVDSNSNTDGFHVFRMAKTSTGEVWLWRDGELLNPGGTALAESRLRQRRWPDSRIAMISSSSS